MKKKSIYTKVEVYNLNVDNKWEIVGWKTDNDNENGVVVGTIDNETYKVSFVNRKVENDELVIAEVKRFLADIVDYIAKKEEHHGWEVNGWEITDDCIEIELTRMNDKTWTTIFRVELDDIDFDTLVRYLKQ